MDARDGTPLTDLALNILLALGDGPLHGYGIIKDIESRTGAQTNLRSGTLYLALRRLEQDGLVRKSAAPASADAKDVRRRYYALTARGRRVAVAELQRLRDLVAAGSRRRLLNVEEA